MNQYDNLHPSTIYSERNKVSGDTRGIKMNQYDHLHPSTIYSENNKISDGEVRIFLPFPPELIHDFVPDVGSLDTLLEFESIEVHRVLHGTLGRWAEYDAIHCIDIPKSVFDRIKGDLEVYFEGIKTDYVLATTGLYNLFVGFSINGKDVSNQNGDVTWSEFVGWLKEGEEDRFDEWMSIFK